MGKQSQSSPLPAMDADDLIKAQKSQQVDEITPYGSRLYSDVDGRRTATTTFSSEIQGSAQHETRSLFSAISQLW